MSAHAVKPSYIADASVRLGPCRGAMVFAGVTRWLRNSAQNAELLRIDLGLAISVNDLSASSADSEPTAVTSADGEGGSGDPKKGLRKPGQRPARLYR